jgi:hypothetical protein
MGWVVGLQCPIRAIFRQEFQKLMREKTKDAFMDFLNG